jgi:hypothetical protein
MSAIPKYTRTEINSLRVGPLKEALIAIGLQFNGGVGEGRKILKAALYPPPVVTGAASQPNPRPPIHPPEANHESASQPNLSPVPPNLPAVQGGVVQEEVREQWHLLKQSSGPVYTRIPLASRNKASRIYESLLLPYTQKTTNQHGIKFSIFPGVVWVVPKEEAKTILRKPP